MVMDYEWNCPLNAAVVPSQNPPGSVLDEAPDLIVPPEVLEKLLSRDELQSPRQFLQLYDSPLNVGMDFGEKEKEKKKKQQQQLPAEI